MEVEALDTNAGTHQIKQDFSLDHVAVSVSDLDRSIKFYGENFGFKCDRIMDRPQGAGRVALLKKPGFAIEMFGYAGPSPLPDFHKSLETDLRIIGVKHFAIKVNDILDAADSLKNNGVEVVSPVAVGVRGLRRFLVKDPDGLLIEITE